MASTQLDAKSTGDDVAMVFPDAAQGKTALITGGNSGLGLETARVLASRGCEVIVACRSQKNADEAVAKIKERVGGARVTSMLLDLADQKQVASAARAFVATGKPLHLLVNNAGVMACPFSLTKDGFEMQWGTNHMGHFTLTQHLLPALKAGGTAADPSRIINLSSMGNWIFGPAEGIRWDKVKAPTAAEYSPWVSYAESKLANILHAKELTKRVQGGASASPVVAFSVHPGAIMETNLGRNAFGSVWTTLAMLAYSRVWYVTLTEPFKTTPQGVATTIFTALAPVEGRGAQGTKGNTRTVQPGQYYADCAPGPLIHAKASDEALASKLWEESEAAMRRALA